MEGGRASSIFVVDDVTPRTVGALIAMYEHRTFAYGMLLGINPFDQWGVELGKVMAEEIDQALAGESQKDRDPTTMRLIEKFKNKRS
jgi:glucose-6-phosphate isomerase